MTLTIGLCLSRAKGLKWACWRQIAAVDVLSLLLLILLLLILLLLILLLILLLLMLPALPVRLSVMGVHFVQRCSKGGAD